MAELISNPRFPIVEIFESLQGEGFNTGMPAIFVRFGKCNLTCPWCDTNYNQFEQWTLSDILAKVSYSAKNVIITGGEPTIQPNLSLLLEQFKKEDIFSDRNQRLKEVPAQIDYIATSPKRMYQESINAVALNLRMKSVSSLMEKYRVSVSK